MPLVLAVPGNDAGTPVSSLTVGSTTISSGTDTRVPFNDAGVYNEDAGLTYNKSSNTLTVGTQIVSGEVGVSTGSLLLNSGGTGAVKIQVDETSVSSYTMTLPTAVGSSGQVLADTDGSGTLGWVNNDAGITNGTTTITGGTDSNIPYNNGGVWGESTNFQFDDTDSSLKVAASLNSAGSLGETFIHDMSVSIATSGTQSGTDYLCGGTSLTLTGTGNITADVTNLATWAASGGIVTGAGTHTFNTPISGMGGVARITGGGTYAQVMGSVGVAIDAGAATITSLIGSYSKVVKAGGSTVTNLIGHEIAPIDTGTATNSIGLNIGDVSVGTNKFAIKTGTGKVSLGDALDVSGNFSTLSGGTATIDGGFRANDTSDLVGNVSCKASLDVADDLQMSQGANTAASTNMVLGQTGNSFYITLGGTIDSISSTGWQNGSIVILQFATDTTITSNASGLSGDDRQISLDGDIDWDATTEDVLGLVLMDSVWQEFGRKRNTFATKHLSIQNADLGKGTTAPTQVITGYYTAWEFTTGDDATMSLELPHDLDTTKDIELHFSWYIDEAYATNSGEVQWQVDWALTPSDSTEAIDSPTHSGTLTTGDINIPATAKYLTQTNSLTINASNISTDDILGIKLSRIAIDDGSNPTADPAVTGFHVEYTPLYM